MKKVLILGAYGYLGTALSHYLISQDLNVWRQGRGEGSQVRLDIFDLDELRIFLKKNRVDCIVNLIAITDVECCESNYDLAMKVNALSVSGIMQVIDSFPEEIKPHLIHISTDQVYSGPGPHVEHKVGPINVYGATKLAGEGYAISPRSTILRVNFIGKSQIESRKSLSDWLVESARQRKSIVVYEDVVFSPLHIKTLCHILFLVIQRQIFGIFNLGSSSSIDKATFAFKLTSLAGLSSELFIKGKLEGGSKTMPRPLDMSLNVSKIEKELELKLPTIDVEVDKNAKEYKIE
jgi:dTDP-4-dehydrorhamnose reductase